MIAYFVKSSFSKQECLHPTFKLYTQLILYSEDCLHYVIKLSFTFQTIPSKGPLSSAIHTDQQSSILAKAFLLYTNLSFSLFERAHARARMTLMFTHDKSLLRLFFLAQ